MTQRRFFFNQEEPTGNTQQNVPPQLRTAIRDGKPSDPGLYDLPRITKTPTTKNWAEEGGNVASVTTAEAPASLEQKEGPGVNAQWEWSFGPPDANQQQNNNDEEGATTCLGELQKLLCRRP